MNFFYPEKPLYLECNLPEDIFEQLKKDIDSEENSKIPWNIQLAGNIANEYAMTYANLKFIEFIENKATQFFKKDREIVLAKDNKIILDRPNDCDIKLTLESLWINKQKKYEFNPTHSHSGLVSFVCWVKIPYNLEDEMNSNNCKKSNMPRNSLFEFIHSDLHGSIREHPIMVDKSYEGKCLFFNSQTLHQVYPFYTSDDYRISISGNFGLIENKKTNKISYS